VKKLITNYTFSPSARTVTFNGYATVDLRGLIIITNVDANVVIYSYTDLDSPYSLGGSAATNVVTLNYDTTKMGASDKLQIYYDDQSAESDAASSGDQRYEYNADDNVIYSGTHSLQDADPDDLNWMVSKYTWDASNNCTRIETLVGSWTGRALLGWGV
jgi:hypothetical protein